MATSAVPAVIDALVVAFTAALSATVYDGPQVGDTSSRPHRYVAIGWDGSDEVTTGDDATFTQRWAQLGAQRKEEEGSVTCAVISWSGDADPGPRRTDAFALLADCENVLRADPSLGGVVRMSAIEGGALVQQVSPDGNAARVPFTVTYVKRI